MIAIGVDQIMLMTVVIENEIGMNPRDATFEWLDPSPVGSILYIYWMTCRSVWEFSGTVLGSNLKELPFSEIHQII